MGAGDSAAAEAERERRNAARLHRRAANKDFRADSFEKGAAGEVEVAAALEPLRATGWRFLHDRCHPSGGNIDHLAVGPPGVCVIDAKNWSSQAKVTTDRRLAAGKETDTLEKLEATVEQIRRTLRADGRSIAVRGRVVLTGETNRSFAVQQVADVAVVGLDGIEAELRRFRSDLDEDLIEAVWRTLANAYPDASATPPTPGRGAGVNGPEELSQPSALFDKAQRFLYLNRWKRGGHDRFYVRDDSGATLGWTDIRTGSMSIDCKGNDAKLVEAVLAAVDPTGVKLDASELPKIATRVRGGRFLSRIARLHTSLLIGVEWRNYGKHRLYGTLIDPSEADYELGYIDLKARSIHPVGDGSDLSECRSPARTYLEYLLARYPEKS